MRGCIRPFLRLIWVSSISDGQGLKQASVPSINPDGDAKCLTYSPRQFVALDVLTNTTERAVPHEIVRSKLLPNAGLRKCNRQMLHLLFQRIALFC